VLSKAAATPLRGAFWGAVVTLLVQSSSATTMTTIGLVSAGLLTFAQGLGLVLGANVGTTGTGWLVALIGVRVSLTAAALPMIFVGALIKLLSRGRVSAAGAALAGFALVLFGLTTLQQGMGVWPNGCIQRICRLFWAPLASDGGPARWPCSC
jgi:phosphate:Na+ symporter